MSDYRAIEECITADVLLLPQILQDFPLYVYHLAKFHPIKGG